MKTKTKYFLFPILSLFFLLLLICNILVSTHKIYSYEVNKINTKEKVVMLTFDDGPDLRPDNQILDILEQEQVRDMFFQIGINLTNRLYHPNPATSNKYLALETRMLTGSSYSWIGNHTYFHLKYLNKAKKLLQK